MSKLGPPARCTRARVFALAGCGSSSSSSTSTPTRPRRPEASKRGGSPPRYPRDKSKGTLNVATEAHVRAEEFVAPDGPTIIGRTGPRKKAPSRPGGF